MACICYVFAGSALLQLAMLLVNFAISAYPPIIVLFSIFITSEDGRVALSDSDYVFSSSISKLVFVLPKSLFVLLSFLLVCSAFMSKKGFKVNSAILLTLQAKVAAIAFLVFALINFIVDIIYVVDLSATNVVDLDEVTFGSTFVWVYILFLMILLSLRGFLFLLFVRSSIRLETTAVQFHNFLTAHRQTPRSKIMKKHKPIMDLVMEEESNYEKSSIMITKRGYSGFPLLTAKEDKNHFSTSLNDEDVSFLLPEQKEFTFSEYNKSTVNRSSNLLETDELIPQEFKFTPNAHKA